MKFFVDVNLSKPKKFFEEHQNLINVKEEYNEKISDKKLIQHAKKRKIGIYTQDKECALYALIEGVPVWYRDQKTKKSYKIKAQKLKFTENEIKSKL